MQVSCDMVSDWLTRRHERHERTDGPQHSGKSCMFPFFQDCFYIGLFLPRPFLPDRFYQDRYYLHPLQWNGCVCADVWRVSHRRGCGFLMTVSVLLLAITTTHFPFLKYGLCFTLIYLNLYICFGFLCRKCHVSSKCFQLYLPISHLVSHFTLCSYNCIRMWCYWLHA